MTDDQETREQEQYDAALAELKENYGDNHEKETET